MNSVAITTLTWYLTLLLSRISDRFYNVYFNLVERILSRLYRTYPNLPEQIVHAWLRLAPWIFEWWAGEEDGFRQWLNADGQPRPPPGLPWNRAIWLRYQGRYILHLAVLISYETMDNYFAFHQFGDEQQAN